MMYQFRDVTAGQVVDNSRPAEALKINGIYIEDEIAGYRTLYVKGREAFTAEVETYDIGTRDGSVLQKRRFPARTITVGYQLICSSTAAFRTAFNKLNSILNVIDAELIFADESDKFFIGTPVEPEEVDAGSNSIVSEISFICVDPFKYSVTEHEVTAQNQEDHSALLAVDYVGTYPASPVFEAEFPKIEDEYGGNTLINDCGYVAYYDSNNHIIQLGNPEEVDNYHEVERSVQLINQTFNGTIPSSSSWPRNTQAWYMESLLITNAGSVKIDWMNSTKTLRPNSYGTNANAWHGPNITKNIPSNSECVNWTFSFKYYFKHTANAQQGQLQVFVMNQAAVAAGIVICKGSAGTKGTIKLIINHTKRKEIEVDFSKAKSETATIIKSGSKFTFTIGGKTYSITDGSVAAYECSGISIGFYQCKAIAAVANNVVYSVKLIKNTGIYEWEDVPNKFNPGDVLTADCNTGEVYLRLDGGDYDDEISARSPGLGALGNDWETFKLVPGTNQIGVSYSDFTDTPPTFKMRYREVFL